jgi:hypothetical protein
MTIRERIIDGDKSKGEFHIIKTQDCEGIMKAIHAIPDHIMRSRINTQYSQRYVGSVPNVVALRWAHEWGVKLYSKEWLEKTRHRLKFDPNWRKLRMDQKL